MPTRDEVEVSLKDSISAGLRKIGSHLDEINSKANEARKAAGGQDSLGQANNETARLGQKSDRASRALGGGSGLGGVLSSFSLAVLGPPGLLLGALVAATKALENFSISRVRLQSFATDTRLTTSNVQELRQALAMMGRESGEQNAIIAKLSDKLDKLQYGRSDVWRVFERVPEGSGMPMLLRWREMLKVPGGKMAAIRDVAKSFREQSAAGQDLFALAFDMDKSVLGGLLDALAETVPEARADAEQMRAHLLRMIKLRGELDAQWMQVKMFAVDVGVQIGEALQSEGVSFEAVRTQIKQAFESINYEMVATALIAIGRDMEIAEREIRYSMESMSAVIEWIKKYSPIQIQILSPEDREQLEELYAINEKLRIDKDTARNLVDIGAQMTDIFLGRRPGGPYVPIGLTGYARGQARRGILGGNRGSGRAGGAMGQGGQLEAGELQPPVAGGRVISERGASRGGGTREHKGMDIAAPMGTSVTASGSQKVTQIGYSQGGYGYFVKTEDAQGREHVYAHLMDDPTKLGIRRGMALSAGQQLGLVGDTGNARGTPPHLHYEVRPGRGRYDDAYNPRQFFGRKQQADTGSGSTTGTGGSGEQTRAMIERIFTEEGVDPRVGYGIVAGESLHRDRYDVAINAREESYSMWQLNRRRGLGTEFERETGHFLPQPTARMIEDATRFTARHIKKTGSTRPWYGYRGLQQWDPQWGSMGYSPDTSAEKAIDLRLRDEAQARRIPGVKAQVNFRNVPAGVRTSAKLEGKGDIIKELTQTRSRHFGERMPADL